MRYFIIPQRIQQNVILFDDDQMHHMRKVLRKKPGDKVECFDNKGNVYTVEIKKLSKDGSVGKVINIEKHDLLSKNRITILQAFPSSLPKLDLTVEKCTELDADDFIFYKSKRSELYVFPSEEKIERWKKIAMKASEQSERLNVPGIFCLKDLEELNLDLYDLKILLYENSKTQSWNDIAAKFSDYKNILIAIGPEGGWTPEEVLNYQVLGFKDIRPFENILRTETAPIAAVSILKNYLYGNQ